MKYKILTSDTSSLLEQEVNNFLQDGWKLQGGISVSQSFETYENSRKGYTESDTDYTFVQAIIKDENNN